MTIITNSQEIEMLPIAYGVVLRPFTRIRLFGYINTFTKGLRVIVKCPYCGKQHIHGWADVPDPIETRGAHCEKGGQYQIKLVDGCEDE